MRLKIIINSTEIISDELKTQDALIEAIESKLKS